MSGPGRPGSPGTPGKPDNPGSPGAPGAPLLELDGVAVALGGRTLWSGLDLTVGPGEFIAVLGANGSGKSTLLRAILGEVPLQSGTIRIAGRPVTRGDRRIGYVPQRTEIDPISPIRARDLVRLGLDGHRWGMGLRGRRSATRQVDELLAAVGAHGFADAPVAELSGGELQRVRVAEALAGRPDLLLCDEPLAALDLAQAATVVRVIDQHRRRDGTAILFVTHDINSVLDVADRVLYLAGGRFRLGTPAEVLTSAGLTELYGAPVDVIHSGDRILVVASTDPGADTHGASAHADHVELDPDCEDPHGHRHLYGVRETAGAAAGQEGGP